VHPAALAAIALLSALQAGPKPEEQLVAVVKAYLGMELPTDWDGVEKLPNTKWSQLPPTSLQNCLPNGDCYARQGSAAIGGRNLALVATGARTMVINLLFRNTAAPIGEAAILAALKQVGLTADLARCPVKSGVGGTNWYRLKAAGLAPGFLSIQTVVGARPSEGFVLSQGEELPALQPNQLAIYTEQCAPGSERKPVSVAKPHEKLAELVVALLAPAAGPALYDFTALKALPTDATWFAGPTKGAPQPGGDPNPLWQSGSLTLAGRKFSVVGIGTATQVKAVTLEEQRLHPRGEHMLGVVYEKGITVVLVRCGPIYTESTNNWYRLTSAKTRPAMIKQSIRYDGNQVQDSYELRLDGTLPARDPRDRDPGVNGCR
jgi:hypothetical protein